MNFTTTRIKASIESERETMTTTTTIEIRNQVSQLIKEANDRYHEFIPLPDIKFSNRMTKTAGTAKCWRNKATDPVITFSLPILRDNDIDKFKATIVPHEVAHIVEYYVYNSMGHGREFKDIMNEFGVVKPDRCHSFKTTRNNLHTVWCQKCGKELTMGKIQFGRVQSGLVYTHRACGGGTVVNYNPNTLK